MTLVAPGLYYRHLELEEVLARIRKRHIGEVAQHNAAVTAPAESRESLHAEVLEQFTPTARRMAR